MFFGDLGHGKMIVGVGSTTISDHLLEAIRKEIPHHGAALIRTHRVLPHQFGGGNDITLPAKSQNLVVLFIRAFDSVSEIQLQPCVPLAAIIHVADNGHKARLVGP